jgi:hypothetical protein
MDRPRDLNATFQLLSELLYRPDVARVDMIRGTKDLEALTLLATKNHVILRAFAPLRQRFEADGDADAAQWVRNAVKQEEDRIRHAIPRLEEICTVLDEGGCRAIVMKSLDHWPDLGSDLDLFIDADPAAVLGIMKSRFKAELAPRSWGDRLAGKWNFVVPGLPELVEIHIGRLGQTGEQTALSRSLSRRASVEPVGGVSFRVPAPEDRVVVSTLQRMYRHFYIRLCDIVDIARLVESGAVDFDYLRSLGSASGIWEGIAAYLKIISDYVAAYRGEGIPLPSFVSEAAEFGAEQIFYRRDFLRVPIVPHSLGLYASELKQLLLNRELGNSFRLTLLPCLATAAAIELKITGSDKGIW